jgi:RNase P subunit RPR2
MAFMDFLTRMTCSTCKTELVRVPQALFPIAETKPDTSIVCVDCGALGRYEEVVKGAGLIRVLTKDQCDNLVAKLRVS